MKNANQLTPHFNNKAPENTILAFCLKGRTIEITAQQLKIIKEKPVIFVFSHVNNIWARDFILQFNTALLDWIPGGDFPSPVFIITTECRGDLQEKLLFNPEILTNNVSHIVSIGNMASAEVARFRLAHNRMNIPQLFCISGDLDSLELTTIDGTLINNTNGVYASDVNSFAKPLRVLKHVGHKVQSIAIVCGKKSRFDFIADQKEMMVKKIIEACAMQGLEVQSLLIDENSNYEKDFAHTIGTVDAFLTLQDTTVYAQNQAITDFCNKHHIIFMASELSSVLRGASLGFGNSPSAYIPLLIELIALQRATHKPLHTLEIATLKESTDIRYNLRNIKKQVADLSEEKTDLLEMLSIHASY